MKVKMIGDDGSIYASSFQTSGVCGLFKKLNWFKKKQLYMKLILTIWVQIFHPPLFRLAQKLLQTVETYRGNKQMTWGQRISILGVINKGLKQTFINLLFLV